MDSDRMQRELDAVRQEREKFVRAAERQIAAFDGAIQAFERMLGMDGDDNKGLSDPHPGPLPRGEGTASK